MINKSIIEIIELLNKYTKTQEKLEYLKRHQKLMKLESNSLTLKPIKIPQLKIDQQNENQFNPHKVNIKL